MIRASLTLGAVLLWLACFGVAMLTIIPLSAMGLGSIFESSFTVTERLQGFGFFVLGLLAVAALLVALTYLSRSFAKGRNAPNP